MEEALISKGTIYRDEGMGKGASKDVEVLATVGSYYHCRSEEARRAKGLAAGEGATP